VRARTVRGQLGRALLVAVPARSGRGQLGQGLAGGGACQVRQGAAPTRSGVGRRAPGLAGVAPMRSGQGEARATSDRERRAPRRTGAAPATSSVDIAGDEAVPPARARGIFFFVYFISFYYVGIEEDFV
jgi:hypothetical protein